MNSFEKLHSENVRTEAEGAILILPVGAVEQHGPHLPLTVDTEIPVRIASMLVEKLNVIVAPAVPYGARSLPQSGGGPSFPGTINIRGSVLTEYLKDVINGYIATGFRSIVILNGHYENESFIFEALELCRQEGKLEGTKIIAIGWWSLVSNATLQKLFGDRFPGWHAEHASACETSLMLHLRSDLVGPTRVDFQSRRSGKQLACNCRNRHRVVRGDLLATGCVGPGAYGSRAYAEKRRIDGTLIRAVQRVVCPGILATT